MVRQELIPQSEGVVGQAGAYLDDFFAAAGFFAGAFFGAERFRASSWSQGDGAAESGSGSAGREAQAQEP